MHMLNRFLYIILSALLVCALSFGAIAAVDPPESTSASALSNNAPGKQETPIGSLIADAFRAAMHADVAFVAAGDLKSTDDALPAGKVQSSDVLSVIAYPDEKVVVLALDGRKIRNALEISVGTYPRAGLSFLQVSGLKFSYDAAKPAGQRITSVTIGSSAIIDDHAYTVAVGRSLADGALGYWKVWSKNNIVSSKEPVLSSVAINSYFRTHSKLDYSSLDRILHVK